LHYAAVVPKRVFITVAEVSGDKHAAQLARGLRALDPEVVIEGLGGPEMTRAGVTIHRETVGDAAMMHHALSRVREVLRLLKWTRQYFRTNPPDLHICVDSPAMNFHFAKLAKSFDIPVMYYVAPQLWAWREGRMKKLRRWVDRVACILPFEERYFRDHGVNATFVGHPLFDELPVDRARERQETRFPHRPPVIGLLGGSRRSEATVNFPHQLEVAQHILHAFPDASFLAPTTAATQPVVMRSIDRASPALRQRITVGEDQFNAMVPRCDLCITVSGTATLHVAGWGVPMIVVYRGSPLLWHLVGRWVIRTRTFALVNLLSDVHKHIVPEYVPWHGSNRPLADLAIDMLRHPEKLDAQRQRLLRLVRTLDKPGASMNAAKVAMSLLVSEQATEVMMKS
jgi:lipid-A-disaccharide synthase